MAHEGTVEAIKAAPPIAVVGAIFTGAELDLWVKLLTIIYIVVQIVILVRKDRRAKQEKQDEEDR
jgi:hypothetical protein